MADSEQFHAAHAPTSREGHGSGTLGTRGSQVQSRAPHMLSTKSNAGSPQQPVTEPYYPPAYRRKEKTICNANI